MKTTQLELIALIEGETTVAVLASRHGVSEQDIVGWRAAFVGGMKAASSGVVVPRRPRARWFAALAVVGTMAFAQLTTFTPNSPALASEVNGTFNTLKTWLEQKVGAVNTPNITTTGSVSASGGVTGGSITTAGNLSVTGDSSLGAAGRTLTVTGTVAAFGPATTVVAGSTYTAGSDGLLTVSFSGGANCSVVGVFAFVNSQIRLQDSARADCNGTVADALNNFSMPVRKGEQFNISIYGTPTVTATFIPFGR